jgi:hypothetical protein
MSVTFVRRLVAVLGILGMLLGAGTALTYAAGHEPPATTEPSDQADQGAKPAVRSPEEKMARRFPQPVKVGDLIDLAVLDWRDNTIGYVGDVVQTPDGKIQLIVPYRARLGWLRCGGYCDWGRRPVAVPLETAAILGRQIAALDMPHEAFAAAPRFDKGQASSLDPATMIRIAITRR